MENLLIFAGVMIVLVIAVNLFSGKDKNQKQPTGGCKTCPDYQYCGGGRPRCVRRSKTL